MSVSNLSWLKKKSQSVDITAPGFNPLGGAGKQAPQASKAPAPKTPIIEEEQNNSANTQKHPSRKTELKRFYTIGELGESASAVGSSIATAAERKGMLSGEARAEEILSKY